MDTAKRTDRRYLIIGNDTLTSHRFQLRPLSTQQQENARGDGQDGHQDRERPKADTEETDNADEDQINSQKDYPDVSRRVDWRCHAGEYAGRPACQAVNGADERG
jgi:hypothetical protein